MEEVNIPAGTEGGGVKGIHYRMLVVHKFIAYRIYSKKAFIRINTVFSISRRFN